MKSRRGIGVTAVIVALSVLGCPGKAFEIELDGEKFVLTRGMTMGQVTALLDTADREEQEIGGSFLWTYDDGKRAYVMRMRAGRIDWVKPTVSAPVVEHVERGGCGQLYKGVGLKRAVAVYVKHAKKVRLKVTKKTIEKDQAKLLLTYVQRGNPYQHQLAYEFWLKERGTEVCGDNSKIKGPEKEDIKTYQRYMRVFEEQLVDLSVGTQRELSKKRR